MLVGTIFGVIVIPGLYYIFAKLADGRKMIQAEDESPLSEDMIHYE
jgi:HAE1 family hydrophobic/amphiphilic exporter-1